ncbi:putative membrane protein [Helicobacter pylori SouthAfrica20]|uniref:Putative membrane protein n=1 Tax=Helicobacter pylori SouthAfrica20 TaxID=1352356 RepID=T1UCM2_HELPX|nr:putative membrane protein [Helicobacter pylori SouthAfrica20]
MASLITASQTLIENLKKKWALFYCFVCFVLVGFVGLGCFSLTFF